MLMTGKEYLDSIRDGRRVYIGGEVVEDVTAHPAFAPRLMIHMQLPLPFAWRRTCSTQACSGEMPRTMPVTWARRLSTCEAGIGCGVETGIGTAADPGRANLLLADPSGGGSRISTVESLHHRHGKRIDAIAYLRTSSAANVGSDKDSDKRQRAAI